MSGNPTGSNVVPMPHAQAASNPAQVPMPFPMWGGGGSLPWGQTGCCPPGGMDALLKCYCDVQAATAFICSVMVQCVQNNPAVVQAIIAAIEASGSSLPLIGVTNGSNAQPGQVGEYIEFTQTVAVPAGDSTQSISMGVLQPGDWECQIFVDVGSTVSWTSIQMGQISTPGFSYPLFFGQNQGLATVLSPNLRGSISVPTLMAFTLTLVGATSAGQVVPVFNAWRMR